MKYIITESRLNELVHKFITDLIGDLDCRDVMSTESLYVRCKDSDGRVIFEYDDDSLGVREDAWNSVESMFSLTGYEVDKAFMNWIYEYDGTEFPDGVYTFE